MSCKSRFVTPFGVSVTIFHYINLKLLYRILLAIVSVIFINACSGSSNNAAPNAMSDTLFTTANTTASGTLLASDPENQPLTFVIETNGTRGIATITNSSTGDYTYSPNTNVFGDDTFTFRANDGNSVSNLAAITVHIEDVTTAVDDNYIIDEGASIKTETVLTNDTLNIISPNLILLVTPPVFATVFNLNTDGTFDYTHDGTENFSDNFSYKINNGSTDSNIATVSITIIPQNDPPIAIDKSYTVIESTVLNIDINSGLKLDSSDDDNTITELSALLVNAPTNAISFTLNADGSFIYTHDGSEINNDVFTFKLTDGTDDSNLSTVTITIILINDAPIATNNSYSVNEGKTITIDTSAGLRANDSDADNILTDLVVTLVGSPPTNAATFTLFPDGSFTYVHDGGETTTDNFSYKLNDGMLNSNVATVDISITAINDAPIATAGICQVTPRENVLNGTVSGIDPDHTANLLMYSIPLNDDGSKGTAVITDPTTGAFTYTPNTGVSTIGGTDTFTFTVTDPDGAQDSSIVRVEINPKIMLLGDSITTGIEDGSNGLPTNSNRTGFRKPLFDALVVDGFQIDFVGSLSSGTAFTGADAFDVDHEGHPGWRDDEIAFGRIGELTPNGVYEWLNATTAEYVLIHIGTNDLNADPTDVENILNEIDRFENDNNKTIEVLLAKIIDWNPINPTVTTFNNNVVTMALDRVNNQFNPAYPDNIIIVDQQNALSYPIDLTAGDALHPNSSGYTKMATTWLDTLKSLLSKCP